ncbi:MAG: hypothetical protein ACRDZO_06710 [Egibacteraceae bacterium]
MLGRLLASGEDEVGAGVGGEDRVAEAGVGEQREPAGWAARPMSICPGSTASRAFRTWWL